MKNLLSTMREILDLFAAAFFVGFGFTAGAFAAAGWLL